MPAERRFGMDHEHYDWSPLSRRARLQWPEARVAVCVLINLEHTEWSPPADSVQVTSTAPGMIPRPFPDYARLTHREYGHRVGIFRLMGVLERYGIAPTVAMDALTAEHYPYLVRYCLERGCEIIGHGIAATRMMTSKMSEAEEQTYIRDAIATLTRATGKAPLGWLSPEYSQSPRTPQLLAQAGIRYVCDWVNDEQPYRMHTPAGDLFALPVMLELDDVHALWERRVPVARYGEMLKDSFRRLYRDGAQNGRLLVIHLHPWLIGQPFRIRYLDDALKFMTRHQGTWVTHGAKIIDWFQQHPPVG